jgi:hypothetical protein
VPGIRLVPIVENLREVPLEAWSMVYMVSSSPYSGVTTDTCASRPAPVGHGAIAPSESRRLTPLPDFPPDKAEFVTIRLGFAYFQDGYKEGDANETRRVLDQRKARGVDCTR